MSAQAAPLQFTPPVMQEDQARADFYALLARLWYAPPDAELLLAIAQADDVVSEQEHSTLVYAWRQLALAAAATDPEAARDEYDSVFVGTGKAEVTPYLTHYLPGTTGKEKVLAALRAELAQMGLSRAANAHEPEDHIAGLCDVMRHLIVNGAVIGAGEEGLRRQQQFFDRYLRPAHAAFAAQAQEAQGTNFYKHLARFTQAFFAIEAESFDML